jgi:hypothetical protein
VLEIDARTRLLDGWEDKGVGGTNCFACAHWGNPGGGDNRCTCHTNCCAGFRKRANP